MKAVTSFLCYSVLLALVFIFSSSFIHAQNIRVNVTELASARGKIVLSVFKDNERFKKEVPARVITFSKQGLVNGALTLNFTLEPGVYGITLLDDENENGKMEKNMIGIPKEGFGFSNFYLQKMKRPVFDDFKTEIKTGNNVVNIRMKYM